MTGGPLQSRRSEGLLIGASLIVTVAWPLVLAEFLWLPEGQKLLAELLAVVTGAGVFLFTVSGRRERSWKRSLRLSVLTAAAVIVLALSHVGLMGAFVLQLDTLAPGAHGEQAGEDLLQTDPSFPSGKLLRVPTSSAAIQRRLSAERKLDPSFDETDLIKSDPSWYQDKVREDDSLRLLGLTLAFLATFLGSTLSASALAACLTGLVTGAGLKEYEFGEFPLPAGDEAIDVFLSYNHHDTEIVLALAERLRDAGLNVWLDRWSAPAGTAWPARIDSAIRSARSAAICRGADPMGHWQELEVNGFHARTHSGLRLIPVMLPGCGGPAELSGLLAVFTAVDLRSGVQSAGFEQLLEAIPRSKATPASSPESRS